MVQPVNLQLAHYNVEHSAQFSKEAIAAAQQTAQGQQVVQESLQRTQKVQANLAAAEAQKVKRKGDEEQDRRGGGAFDEQKREELPEESTVAFIEGDGAASGPRKDTSTAKTFDFYA